MFKLKFLEIKKKSCNAGLNSLNWKIHINKHTVKHELHNLEHKQVIIFFIAVKLTRH